MIPENPLNIKGKRVVVGLSGGVDSAVCALLLQRAGAEVETVFMQNWAEEDETAACHDKEDMIAAAAAAETLSLPFSLLNFAEAYQSEVFTPFLHELKRGRTPNPDVLCNSHIKFSAFHRYAETRAAVAVATGHYARTAFAADGCRLYKGEDSAKDQTYFLHRLTSAQLAYSLFPLGGYHKSEVRALARDAGLGNWQRRDSTGICFIGERDFAEFIARYLPPQPGDIRDENGNRLGRHNGLHFYTIGQRRGIGLGGGAAWFVAAKHPEENELVVVQDEQHPLLYRQRVEIENVHWINGSPPPTRWVYAARLRHRQTPASCTLSAADAKTAVIEFAEPQRAVTPGQYAVIYDGDWCLGGGVICAA